MRKQGGFTLIEIAIVLVIIGLLLGGVLKGQELITSARVRNLISQQDGIKAAYFGFLDRYRALPGDYSQAQANIPGCSACAQGDNNGQIAGTSGNPTGVSNAAINEYIAVWEHLSKSGFINGSYTFNASETPTSAPTNPYAQYLRLRYDDTYDGSPTARHNLKTGNQISSDILAEVDRKIDDGQATTGSFRFAAFSATGTAPTGSGSCYSATAPNPWQAATPVNNCGGASLF
jgi:prepilin-type N-terminal cleavage/methylation domain-containing protein